MIVKLNKPLVYGGNVLDGDAVVELPYELASNIIKAGNGENYIEPDDEEVYDMDDDKVEADNTDDGKNDAVPIAKKVGRTNKNKRGGKG